MRCIPCHTHDGWCPTTRHSRPASRAYTSNGFNATSGQMHCDSCVIADPMGTPTAAHQQRAKPAARSCIRSLSVVHLCCSHAAAAGCARNGETRAPAVKGREPAGREYEFTVRRSNHLCHRTCVGDSPLTLAMSDTVWRSTHTAAYVRGGCKPDSQPPDLLARRSRRRHRQSARRWGHPLSDDRRGAERDVARRYDSAAPEPRRPPRMQFQCSGVDGARQASAALRLAHSVVCPPATPHPYCQPLAAVRCTDSAPDSCKPATPHARMLKTHVYQPYLTYL